MNIPDLISRLYRGTQNESKQREENTITESHKNGFSFVENDLLVSALRISV